MGSRRIRVILFIYYILVNTELLIMVLVWFGLDEFQIPILRKGGLLCANLSIVMNKIIFCLTLSLIAKLSFAQVKPPLAIKEYDRGTNPVDEITLFDLSEIKERKIDTAYIIRHRASWAEYCPAISPCAYSDTLELYVFDDEGRIIQTTSFPGDYSTTYRFDSLGNIISTGSHRRYGDKPGGYTTPYNPPDTTMFKTVTKRVKEGNDSLITEISLWKFRNGNGFDTATIVVKRFNDKGKLIEKQSSVHTRMIEDCTGEMTYHFKYAYDNEDRLIYYQDLFLDTYKKITYPFYGKLTETYNVRTNELLSREVKLINNDDGIITITFDNGEATTLTPLEKGSKLFKLRTNITRAGYAFPLIEYHEIVYK